MSKVSIIVEAPGWKAPDLRPRLRAAIRRTLKAEGRDGTVTLLLSDDAALKALNRDFRAKDKPTNVLSFPAHPNPEGHLGDIAIAYKTAAREAVAAGKRFDDHVVHLAIHGSLHILGYDHESEAEAGVMEDKERALLAGFGIADPYLSTA